MTFLLLLLWAASPFWTKMLGPFGLSLLHQWFLSHYISDHHFVFLPSSERTQPCVENSEQYIYGDNAKKRYNRAQPHNQQQAT